MGELGAEKAQQVAQALELLVTAQAFALTEEELAAETTEKMMLNGSAAMSIPAKIRRKRTRCAVFPPIRSKSNEKR